MFKRKENIVPKKLTKKARNEKESDGTEHEVVKCAWSIIALIICLIKSYTNLSCVLLNLKQNRCR